MITLSKFKSGVRRSKWDEQQERKCDSGEGLR